MSQITGLFEKEASLLTALSNLTSYMKALCLFNSFLMRMSLILTLLSSINVELFWEQDKEHAISTTTFASVKRKLLVVTATFLFRNCNTICRSSWKFVIVTVHQIHVHLEGKSVMWKIIFNLRCIFVKNVCLDLWTDKIKMKFITVPYIISLPTFLMI
jgi:Zn-dependent protease with chaperone function